MRVLSTYVGTVPSTNIFTLNIIPKFGTGFNVNVFIQGYHHPTKNKPGKATNLSDKNCQLHDCKERGQAKVFVAQKLIAKIV